MKTSLIVCSLCVVILTTASAQSKSDPTTPRLQKQADATQLIVDNKPFLALAAELNNSSASSLAYMKPLWPQLVAAHINTVLTTVSWELVEPEQGKFDFRLVDGLLKQPAEVNTTIRMLARNLERR